MSRVVGGKVFDSDETIIVDRGVVMPKKWLEIAESVDTFQVREDDVWIISQPKAGTTWTQEMAWCIGHDLDFEGAKEVVQKRVPFLEHCMLLTSDVLGPESMDKLPRYYRDSVQYIAEMPSPRYIKTHLPWQLLPRQIQEDVVKPKIIYVARNAKDSCVSRYYHQPLETKFRGSFQEYTKLFIGDNELFWAPFWPHVLTFWERRNQQNILFLKYEDMKKNLASVIRQTALFLGKTLTAEQTSMLDQHLSFEAMQKNDAVNYKNLCQLLDPEIFSGFKFMRKGVVGGWQEMMSADIKREFDEWTEKNLQGTGLTFQDGSLKQS